jgi:hypothetical protein
VPQDSTLIPRQRCDPPLCKSGFMLLNGSCVCPPIPMAWLNGSSCDPCQIYCTRCDIYGYLTCSIGYYLYYALQCQLRHLFSARMYPMLKWFHFAEFWDLLIRGRRNEHNDSKQLNCSLYSRMLSNHANSIELHFANFYIFT